MTLDSGAWKTYDYTLILYDPTLTRYYIVFFKLTINPPPSLADSWGTGEDIKSKEIKIEIPWADFYIKNKGKLPYKMTEPTEDQMKEYLKRKFKESQQRKKE